MIAMAALLKAIRQTLMLSSNLAAQLPIDRIYDRTPDNPSFPYVTFGSVSSVDWSASECEGDEIFIIIDIWSKKRGRNQALSIAKTIASILSSETILIEDHDLILLRIEGIDGVNEPEFDGARASLRLRALTEPKTI